MQVTELTPDQLNALRMVFNYEVNGDTSLIDESEVPNYVIFDYFAGMDFVPEDFGWYEDDEEDEPANRYFETTGAPGQLPPLPQQINIAI